MRRRRIGAHRVTSPASISKLAEKAAVVTMYRPSLTTPELLDGAPAGPAGVGRALLRDVLGQHPQILRGDVVVHDEPRDSVHAQSIRRTAARCPVSLSPPPSPPQQGRAVAHHGPADEAGRHPPPRPDEQLPAEDPEQAQEHPDGRQPPGQGRVGQVEVESPLPPPSLPLHPIVVTQLSLGLGPVALDIFVIHPAEDHGLEDLGGGLTQEGHGVVQAQPDGRHIDLSDLSKSDPFIIPVLHQDAPLHEGERLALTIQIADLGQVKTAVEHGLNPKEKERGLPPYSPADTCPITCTCQMALPLERCITRPASSVRASTFTIRLPPRAG